MLTGVPLGNYWVDYRVTSSDGLVTSVMAEFFLWRKPIITCAVQPTTIDEDRRVVNISGILKGEHPISHEIAPIGGFRLVASASYDAVPPGEATFTNIAVTTASDGGFSTQMRLAGPGWVSASATDRPQDTLVSYGGGNLVMITAVKWPIRLSLQVAATELRTGESTTVDGRLEVMRDGDWRPLAGRAVGLFFMQASPGSTIPVLPNPPVTDAQGRFRVDVTPGSQGYYWATFNEDYQPNPFYEGASAVTATVLVRMPVRFSEDYFIVRQTPIGTDHPWRYELTGILYTPVSPPFIQLQYRSGPAGEWRTLSTTIPDHYSIDGGRVFTGGLTVPGSGEVRAYVAQSDTTQAAGSKVATVIVTPRVFVRPQSIGDIGPRPSDPPGALHPPGTPRP